MNFGYLENLLVRNQEPIFEGTPPSIMLDIKLDCDPTFTRVGAADDFELCAEFCRLMSLLDKIVNGRISRIDVRYGVPRKLLCEQLFANQTTTDS